MIKKLEWDSNFFSKNIAEIDLTDHHNLDLNNLSFDLIVVKQKKDYKFEIFNYSELFKEVKVIFKKDIIKLNDGDYSQIKDTDSESKDFEYFKDLAYESGKMSRFLLDHQFGEEKFKELYDLWVINSLNKEFAIKTFYIEENGEAIGFITLQQYESTGKIGLIATHPEHQRKGLGRKLLEFAENFCVNNNVKILEIPTQKENTNACIFYEKMEYITKELVILKHFWKRS